MKIVILGAGRIGGSLARNLSNSNYEVCIVDENKNKLSDLEDKLDIMTVQGNASQLSTLKKSGLDEETIIIAVTSNDEVNIVACQIAKKVFNVKKTICRFKDNSYFTQLGIFGDGVIDIPISPEDEITSYLKELIDHPGAGQIETFANGKVKLVSVKAKKKGKLVGRELKGIKDDMPDVDAFIAAIYRKGHPFIPSGDTVIKENDEIYFISSESDIGSIVDEFRDHEEQYSRIMIVGGGKVGFSLAKHLEKSYNVKLIDSNTERCMTLSKELDKTIVLNGSATDETLLKRENICLLKIEEYFNKIVKLLNEDLKPFSDKNCKLNHDHFSLDVTKAFDKTCLEAMIKNYIYSITVNKSKDFINNLNLDTNQINISKEDFKKIANFVNKNEKDDNYYLNNNNYKENYNKIINNQNLLKNKPIFLLTKKVKRNNSEKFEKISTIKNLNFEDFLISSSAMSIKYLCPL